MDVRQGVHSAHAKTMTTEDLRREFLIDRIFTPGGITMTYSHIDRIVVGGICPTDKSLVIEAGKEFGVDYLLERRELGTINIGGPGVVTVDGTKYDLASEDGLYVPKGIKDLSFASKDAGNPAKFYFACTPAHTSYPVVKINIADAEPEKLGDPIRATSGPSTSTCIRRC